MLAVRLVPPGLTVASSHLRNDLADFVEPPDHGALYDPLQLRLVRHLDGTLGIVQDRADCLPESVARGLGDRRRSPRRLGPGEPARFAPQRP